MELLSFPVPVPVLPDREERDFPEDRASIVLKDTDQEKWSLDVECNNAGHIHIMAHPRSHASTQGELYIVRLCLDKTKTNSISFGDFMIFLGLFGSISKEIDVSRRPFKYVLDYGYGKSNLFKLDVKEQLISNQSNSCKIVELVTIRTLMNRYHWIVKSVNNVLETEKSNRLPKMRNSSSCWAEITILPPPSGGEIEYVVLNNIVMLPGTPILCKTDDIVINAVSTSSEEIRLAIRSVPARKFLEPKHEQVCCPDGGDWNGDHFSIPNFKHIGNQVSRSPLNSDDGWKLSADINDFSDNWKIVNEPKTKDVPICSNTSELKYLLLKKHGVYGEMLIKERAIEMERDESVESKKEEVAEEVGDQIELKEEVPVDLNFTKILSDTHLPSNKVAKVGAVEIVSKEDEDSSAPTCFEQLIREGAEKILVQRKGALPADSGVLLYAQMGGMNLKSTAMHQTEKRSATPPREHPMNFVPTSVGVKNKFKAYDRNTIELGFVPQKPNPKSEKYPRTSNEYFAMGLRNRKPKTAVSK